MPVDMDIDNNIDVNRVGNVIEVMYVKLKDVCVILTSLDQILRFSAFV